MDKRRAPDLDAHDVAQPHLHAHREQHEQYAGVGDGLETAVVGEPGCVEGESRHEKTDERRHAKGAGDQAEGKCTGNVDPDHGRPPVIRFPKGAGRIQAPGAVVMLPVYCAASALTVSGSRARRDGPACLRQGAPGRLPRP